jgi:PKD repeat protein
MSTKKRFFRQVKILMITIVLLFSIKSLTAQVACSSCTSNDFTFQNFYLGDVVGTPLTGSCTPGSPMTAYLWMQVTNNSTRYSLLVSYDFIETNPLTGVSTTNTVTNCLYNNVAIPSSLISLGTVSWTCGKSLTIDNFQMHWKQNSSIACFYDAPKCLCIPPTIIKAPVAANYSYAACNNGSTSTVNFTSAVVGGTAPFTYAWNFGDASISNSANPSHT